MKKPRRAIRCALIVGLAWAAPILAKDKGLDILISSDAIPSPGGLRPKPGKPIHYVLNLNRLTLGERVGGVKLPEPPSLEKAVVAELEKQGFARTGVGGPVPEIVIIATVGDANFEPPPLPGDANPLFDQEYEPYLRRVNVRQVLEQNLLIEKVGRGIATVDALFGSDPTLSRASGDVGYARDLVFAEALRLRARSSDQGRDRGALLALAGANKVEKAVAQRTLGGAEADRIADATRHDQYYVTLTAFDAARWKEKQKVILWRTTMFIDAREDFSKALPAMLAQGGPVFGTDLPVPGFVNTKSREGKVEVGDTQVVPEAPR